LLLLILIVFNLIIFVVLNTIQYILSHCNLQRHRSLKYACDMGVNGIPGRCHVRPLLLGPTYVRVWQLWLYLPPEEAEKEFQALQKISKDISQKAEALTAIISQLNENEMVKKELGLLEEGAVVYKLIGPTLIKQETEEAQANVSKRIDYLNGEL